MLIYLQMIDGPEDQSKFEQLYLTYRGLMYYVAESILRNEQDAEDAVHDAFVAVAKNISNISEPESKNQSLPRYHCREQGHRFVPSKEEAPVCAVE